MRMTKLRLLAPLVAAAALVAAPAYVSAAPPSMSRMIVPIQFVDDIGPCTQDVDTVLTLTEKVFLGQDGPREVQLHFQFDGTATIVETGTAYRIHHTFMVFIDLATGMSTVVGIPFGTWSEDGGLAFARMGRDVWAGEPLASELISSVGFDNFFGDFSQLCDNV